MREPKMPAGATKPTMERDQGSIRGSGINKIAKDMKPANSGVDQVVMKNRYGLPMPTQKS